MAERGLTRRRFQSKENLYHSRDNPLVPSKAQGP